jgi:hypothetical protein
MVRAHGFRAHGRLRLAILALLAAAAIAEKLPTDGRDAHQRADAVLWPAYISVSNDWALNHGQLSDPGHLEKFNTADKQRFDATCKAFEAWRNAMKQAGY